ncbi:hypothetical protein L218DRAFT_406595 [Marasmius fiardii PR-910]|nr:hypothetical protein L218DRAFT_406595 [Marasmius fiardii PR-910]
MRWVPARSRWGFILTNMTLINFSFILIHFAKRFQLAGWQLSARARTRFDYPSVPSRFPKSRKNTRCSHGKPKEGTFSSFPRCFEKDPVVNT